MSATNIYENINELIKDYYDQPVDDYLNQTITVNEVELVCDVYRVEDESELTSEIFTGCTANDANTQIIIGLNLTVADGVTLIPPYRCKGIIIGCPGNFTNDGTISMTKRGASGAGKDIALVNNYSISAIGGSGGASRSSTGNGNSGNSSSSGVLSCGGGGSGAVYDLFGDSIASFAGGNATSFSGGTGSGGCYAGTTNATAASDTGGAGGNFGVRPKTSLGKFAILGGTGNPKGTSAYAETSQIDSINGYGTGGLIVIFANNLVNNGIIESKGSQAEGFPKSSQSDISSVNVITGGSSGGGCIVLFANSITNNGTVNSEGGLVPTVDSSVTRKYLGGAGGNGTNESIEITDLVLTYPLPLKLGITTKEKLDLLEPVSGRLMGLMDDDELQYEYRGVRHRAMNTEAEIDFSNLPSRGQRTPDAFEVDVNNPQDGQVMRYNATTQQWENGDDYHVYSTNERVVGKWIDGKPLYEKTLNIAYTSDSTRYYIDVPNVDIFVDASIIYFVRNNGSKPHPGVQLGLEDYYFTINSIRASIEGTDPGYPNVSVLDLSVGSIENSRTISFVITVQYTKTTDTV